MEKRIVPQLKGINDYYDQPYNEIYRSVVDIAKDVRRIDSNTSEGIEKCKWVAAMINMLFDTAMHTVTPNRIKNTAMSVADRADT